VTKRERKEIHKYVLQASREILEANREVILARAKQLIKAAVNERTEKA